MAGLVLALRHHSTTRSRTSLECTALDGLQNVACWWLPLHNKWRRDRNRSKSSICTVGRGSCSLDRNHSLHLHGDSLFFTSRPRVHTLTGARTLGWAAACSSFLCCFASSSRMSQSKEEKNGVLPVHPWNVNPFRLFFICLSTGRQRAPAVLSGSPGTGIEAVCCGHTLH